MATVAATIGGGLVTETINRLGAEVAAAVPKVVAGLLFLQRALLVKIIMLVVSQLLSRTVVGKSPVYRQFLTAIVDALFWFAVALAFLGPV
ncbi:MAG: hypothetical protein ACI8VE_001354 [Natrialbaceae archaeon]|jgi:hypothetical protein